MAETVGEGENTMRTGGVFERKNRRWPAIIAAVALLAAWPRAVTCAGSDDTAPPADAAPATAPEESAGAAHPSEIEERVTVSAPRPEFGTEAPERETYTSGRLANMSLAFATVPGVSGVRRSQNGYEPVIRGLGWERVQTQVNGMPLQGACAARMDPPATILNGDAAAAATVVKGLASVTLGPGGSGGRLVVSTDRGPAVMPGTEFTPWVRMAWDESRAGYTGGAGVQGRAGRIDFGAGVQTLSMNDYASADGIVVPAGQDEQGGWANLGIQLGENQRLNIDAMLRRGDEIDYPSLSMDTDWDRDRVYGLAWRFIPLDADHLLAVEARAGVGHIDHQMSNRLKSNFPMVQSESRSYADTAAAGVLVRGRLGAATTWAAGIDALGVGKDSWRESYMTSTGMTTRDHLWPDTSQTIVGAFFEETLLPGEGWRVRLGGRYDLVESDAAAADDPSLGGRTVRQNYIYFYGPDAAVTSKSEGLVTANVLVGRDLNSRVGIEGGVGLVSRAAGVTERYFAFANAPGGYVVGDPTLEAERKYEANVGATFNGRNASGAVSVFHYDFGDYIHQYVLARADVNGDGQTDVIRGFENIPASFVGGEAELTLQPAPGVTIPLAVMYVRAHDDVTGEPLAEIPPLEGRASVLWSIPRAAGVRFDVGGRFVAAQNRVDATFGEDTTPGFSVWHLRGWWEFRPGAYLEAGVENLFDKEHNEHLSREAALAAGDLAAGDEIPQAGRSLFAALRVDF